MTVISQTVTPATAPYLSTFDESNRQWFLGNEVWIRATAAQTAGTLGVVEQVVPPGLGSPYHVHHNEDEEFYILEGQIRFFSGDQSWVLGPGGFAFLPRNVPHGFRTEGDVPSRSLLVATPGGFESFVTELSTTTPPAGPPDMALLIETASRYGVEILGPLPE